MRPVCTHQRKIVDFCSWRGLMVISGTRRSGGDDGHYFSANKNDAGLWFGSVDDLWKFGQPVGQGGPWKETKVQAEAYSLPYLMTGYDKKKVQLIADKAVTITVEVDFDHNGWHTFQSFPLQAGVPVDYAFPEGYSAHWVRVKADKDCVASVQFVYS